MNYLIKLRKDQSNTSLTSRDDENKKIRKISQIFLQNKSKVKPKQRQVSGLWLQYLKSKGSKRKTNQKMLTDVSQLPQLIEPIAGIRRQSCKCTVCGRHGIKLQRLTANFPRFETNHNKWKRRIAKITNINFQASLIKTPTSSSSVKKGKSKQLKMESPSGRKKNDIYQRPSKRNSSMIEIDSNNNNNTGQPKSSFWKQRNSKGAGKNDYPLQPLDKEVVLKIKLIAKQFLLIQKRKGSQDDFKIRYNDFQTDERKKQFTKRRRGTVQLDGHVGKFKSGRPHVDQDRGNHSSGMKNRHYNSDRYIQPSFPKASPGFVSRAVGRYVIQKNLPLLANRPRISKSQDCLTSTERQKNWKIKKISKPEKQSRQQSQEDEDRQIHKAYYINLQFTLQSLLRRGRQI